MTASPALVPAVGGTRQVPAPDPIAADDILEDPLSRLYVFAYADWEKLVSRWVRTAEAPDRLGRFSRLLHEQVTQGRLLAELG